MKFQIWCGAGVNLSGGKTRDGGSMVGGSVFYAAEARETISAKSEVEDAVEHLDKELQENEQRRLEAERLEQQLSSLVWICTSTQKMSKVTVIDANNPADILEVFNVCQSHLLCIASVPGAKESDYAQNSEDLSFRMTNGLSDREASSNGLIEEGQISLESPTSIDESKNILKAVDSEEKSQATSESVSARFSLDEKPSDDLDKVADPEALNTGPQSLENPDSESANLGKVLFVKSTPNLISSTRNDNSGLNGNEEENEHTADVEEPIEKMSSIQPTMWLGAQNGAVYVHSAVAKWSICLHTVRLKDAALAIV